MSEVIDRFMRYISVDTMSAEDADQVPSTPGQMSLAGQLADELRSIGAQDVSLSEHGYVFACLLYTSHAGGVYPHAVAAGLRGDLG